MADTGKRLIDREARERAAADLDSSFCVEAGAGTGKTTILVNRYLSIIRSGRAACGQAVAITFTEKAAGEMKVRLRKEINTLVREGVDDPGEMMRLEAARDGLESAPISTIHSFASSILREYPLEAGIDPNFVQLDGVEGSLLLDECWSEFLVHTAPRHESLLRNWFLAGGSIERLRGFALQVYSCRGERYLEGMFGDSCKPDDGGKGKMDGLESRGGEDSGEYRPGVVKAHIEAVAAELKKLLEACKDPGDRGAVAIMRFLGDARGMDRLSGDELADFLISLEMPKKNKGAMKNWEPAEACRRQKEIAIELAEWQDRFRKVFLDQVRDGLVEWFDEFVDYADARKNRESALDFDDLLIKLRKLLNDTVALESLRKRYRYILVDEFQDTDALQAEIIMLLVGRVGSSDSFDSEPGKLFIVGDPKQSIYRFRKADIEIYEKIKQRLPGTGAHLKITQNFRSVPGVVKWVNNAFSCIITLPESGCYQPGYEPIHAVRDGAGTPVISLDIECAGTKAGEIREAEGKTVARFILDLTGSGLEVRDPGSKLMRRVEFGDIALLYRGMTGIEHYEDPLRDAGIPYMVEGGKLYYTRQEVRDLATALWVIEDPCDALALVTCLRSAMFGFSDEELFLFKRYGGNLDYLSPSLPERGGFEDFAEAFELLRELHETRNSKGPAGIFSELLKRTRYLELSMLRQHGEQRVLNIRKALQSARMFGGKLHSYRYFARWFKDQEKAGVAEGESPAIDEEENAVRLITIHKSKGLQFPVVIIVNLVQKRHAPAKSLAGGGRRLSFSLGKGWETSDFAKSSPADELREEAEAARLLYVAATRAGDMLVIPQTDRKNCYYDMIREYICQAGGEDVTGNGQLSDSRRDDLDDRGLHPSVRVVKASQLPGIIASGTVFPGFGKGENEKSDEAVRVKDKWLQERKRLVARGRKAPVFLSPSGLVDHGQEIFSDMRGKPGPEDPLVFGTAFHRVMEVVEFQGEADIGFLAGPIADAAGLEGGKNKLVELVTRTLASDIFRLVASADTVLREVPFTFSSGSECAGVSLADTGAACFVNGRIDLVFEKDGRWTLLDYKTDNIEGYMVDEAFERYRVQGSVYALAMKKAGFELAGGVIFYFVRPEESRILEITGQLLEETELLISSAAGQKRGAADLRD